MRPGRHQHEQVVDEAGPVAVRALGVPVGTAFVGEQRALGRQVAAHHRLAPTVGQQVAGSSLAANPARS